MKIQVHIGRFLRAYQFFETRAPRAFDGMGTIEYYADEAIRYVLIDENQVAWQTTRYRSGNFAVAPSEAVCELTIEKFLLDRLFPKTH